MARAAKSSEGILTTRKLKALLESGLGGGISSRAGLAMAMCREGEEITVHGIDAWFKHVDSNYAIPRASVDDHRPSYPIPEQRWPVLLDIFGIELEDLACNDDSFRRWCFVRRRARRSRRPQTRLSLDLAYYSTAYSSTVSSASSGGCSGHAAALLDAERQWLLEQGCRIHDLNAAAMESDTAKIHALQRAHLLLCHLDADSLDDTVCEEIVDYARQQRLPLLLSVEPGVALTGRCSPARVLQRPKTFGSRYQQQLFSALSTLADEPAVALGRSCILAPAATDH